VKAGLKDHRAKEEVEGAVELRDGTEGLTWDEKDVNAAHLCVFLMRKLAGEQGIADYVADFFEKYPVKKLREDD
jgi:hypothetical protein